MKIALLNLQYDNNYGGNLQRYALVTVLQGMGHDVTHLNLRFNYIKKRWYSQLYRIIRGFAVKMIKREKIGVFEDYKRQIAYNRKCAVTDVFYNKYVNHTKPIFFKRDLCRYLNYDVFMVGSDQVWRKKIAAIYGISTFFFDYLPDDSEKKRIAYGVSFGTDINELDKQDLSFLTPLYRKFDAVSVREDSALDLIDSYHWYSPKPIQVLDPTLLLNKYNYSLLIDNGKTHPLKGNLFCYILDMTAEKQKLIDNISEQKKLKPFVIGINDTQPSVEQWLRSFRDSDYVITDSYHGFVFATIFNKPFTLIQNAFRGNARFNSLIHTLYKDTSIDNPCWDRVNQNIKNWQSISYSFLNCNLR